MNSRENALFALIFSACANAPETSVKFVDLDGSNTYPSQCTQVPAPTAGSTVTQLSTIDNDRLLAVFPDERQVMLLDDSLRVVWTRVFDKAGPRGVAVPSGAALIDSILFVIDQQQPVLKRFDARGDPMSSIRLSFVPNAIVKAGGTLLIAPAVIGRYPSSLLYRLEGDSVRAERIAPESFDNVSVKMLGNMLAMIPMSRGAILIHQFLTPKAYDWSPDEPIRSLTVPLPQGVRDAVGYVPPVPLDSASLYPALVVAIAAAPDARRNGAVILTRSGKKAGKSSEKVLLLTDSMLNFESARSLPVNAGHLAVLSRHHTAIVVDEEGNWFRCGLN